MTNDKLTDVQCFKKAKEAEQNGNVGESIDYYQTILNENYKFAQHTPLIHLQNSCQAHENIARLKGWFI